MDPDPNPNPDPGHFFKIYVDILPIISGSVDLHIFADPDSDSGSHNLADPTDPDPDP